MIKFYDAKKYQLKVNIHYFDDIFCNFEINQNQDNHEKYTSNS